MQSTGPRRLEAHSGGGGAQSVQSREGLVVKMVSVCFLRVCMAWVLWVEMMSEPKGRGLTLRGQRGHLVHKSQGSDSESVEKHIDNTFFASEWIGQKLKRKAI